MSVLLLRLDGPLQSWGTENSRYTRRHTRTEPTKSGIVGLLAAAQGLRRTDPIEELASLCFGVRVDQRGQLVRDFQTAIRRTGARHESMPLSYRWYLADAVFLAGVEGDAGLLQGLDDALRAPVFPLFLGRRSCPPADGDVTLGVVDGTLADALRGHDWLARDWYRRRQGQQVDLELVLDAEPEDTETETFRDVPLSFDPEFRDYGWRKVVRAPPHRVDNPLGRDEPDFFAAVGGG